MTRKRMKVLGTDSKNDVYAKCSSDEVPSLSDLNVELLVQNILPFVGKNQYRFVGGVNRHFRISYLRLFSPATSFEHVTTVGQARLCCADLSLEQNTQKAAFCELMVRRGRQSIVKYLFSLERRGNNTLTAERFTAAAAEAGHFELLRWLVRQECEVDVETFAAAAVYGDLTMFQWLSSLPRSRYYNDNPPRLVITWNQKAYENAALHGHLPILEWLVSEEIRFPHLGQICSLAAMNGHLHVIKWARSKDFPWNEDTCANAALNGHLETLKWLRSNGCPWNKSACLNAAMNGHLETLKWVHANGCQWDEDTLFEAAKFGHVEVVKWAQSHGCPSNNLEEMCEIAIADGNLEMLKIANTVLGIPVDENMFWDAVANGHLHILKWLHANGCPWDAQSTTAATMIGHFEILKWLREIGCPWDIETMDDAAGNGDLEILQWALANGCPWSESTCASAAFGGHLNILKWLRANGCPWGGSTYYLGMQHGYLDVLDWAFTNGCPATGVGSNIFLHCKPPPGKAESCPDSICLVAAICKQLDVLQWARSRDIPWCDDVCSIAALNRDLEMLDWAFANGCPFPDTYTSLLTAFRCHHKDVLDWFVKNSIGLNAATCATAALQGEFDFFRWLYRIGCPWDESSCTNASANGHDDILSFIREHEYSVNPNDSERNLRLRPMAMADGLPFTHPVATPPTIGRLTRGCTR